MIVQLKDVMLNSRDRKEVTYRKDCPLKYDKERLSLTKGP